MLYTLPEALQMRLDRSENPGGTPVIVYKGKIVDRGCCTVMYTLPEALQKRLDRLENPGGTPVIVYKGKIVIRGCTPCQRHYRSAWIG